MPDRIEHEFLGVDLGDARRNRRLGRVAAQWAQAPAASISAACGGWAESMGAYRLLNAPEVTPGAILAPHQRAVLARAATVPCVLVIQDTTEEAEGTSGGWPMGEPELDFTRMKSMAGCGPLNDETRRGFFLHSLYVQSAEGLPLGLLDAAILVRRDADFRHGAARKKTPIAQKESYRWVQGYRRTQAMARQLPGCEVFSISDREGDIYEVFAAWQQAGEEGGPRAHWIIRANQDRALEGLAVEPPPKLFAALASAPELGTLEFQVPAKAQQRKLKGSTVTVARSARLVRQRLRALRVTPRAPFRRGSKLPAVSFWAVLAEEVDPPAGEEPLRWLLLTSAEVTTPEAARRIVALYLRRWDIEVFHRVLKTGCRVEALQLKDHQAVVNSLMLYAIIAWRILYLRHLGRQRPELPCSTVLEEAEWQAACAVAAARKKRGPPGAPLREPTLGEFIALVAKFGGHLGRRGDKPPGAQALWQGLARVRDFACAWEAFHRK